MQKLQWSFWWIVESDNIIMKWQIPYDWYAHWKETINDKQ